MDDDDREPSGSSADPAPASAAAVWGRLAADAEHAAGGPLWALTDTELVALARTQQALLARLEAGRLAVVRELDVRGVGAAAGACSTASYLAHQLGADPAATARDVRAARRLDPAGDAPREPGLFPTTHPDVVLAVTGRALESGTITRAHADVVAVHVANLPNCPLDPHDPNGPTMRQAGEAFLLAHASGQDPAIYGDGPGLDPGRLRRLGRALQHHLDPDGVLAEEVEATRGRSFWTRPDGAGMLFGGRTDALTGAQLATLVDAHSAPRPTPDPHTGDPVRDPRTADQRRGEAFAHLVQIAAAADGSVSGGNPVQLIVTTTLETLRGEEGQLRVAPAVTETGQVLSAAWARRIACDTTIIPMVLGSRGEPLDVGRATRVVPTGMRKALTIRDRGCAFPGCGRPPRWADAHHVIHWSHGGPTSLDNLVLLCEFHHQVIHHSHWTVHIRNHRPVFTPPPGHPPPLRT